MKIKFGKKEFSIPWEYLAAPVLIILAFIIVISYRAGNGSEEIIPVAASSPPAASGTISPQASADPQVPFDEPEPSDAAIASGEPSPGAESQAPLKVNINKAGMDELDTLPNIGPVKAKAIIDYRNANGPFKSAEDLLNVKGIGPKTLAKLRPLITLD